MCGNGAGIGMAAMQGLHRRIRRERLWARIALGAAAVGAERRLSAGLPLATAIRPAIAANLGFRVVRGGSSPLSSIQ